MSDEGHPTPAHITRMTARQILAEYQGLDSDRTDGESDEELFGRKLWEARQRDSDGQELPLILEPDERGVNQVVGDGHTLVDDVKANGIRRPIGLRSDPSIRGRLGKPEILSGHHRLAAMLAYHPDQLIPVAYYVNTEEAYYTEHPSGREPPQAVLETEHVDPVEEDTTGSVFRRILMTAGKPSKVRRTHKHH